NQQQPPNVPPSNPMQAPNLPQPNGQQPNLPQPKLAVLSGKVTGEDDEPLPGITVRGVGSTTQLNGRVRFGTFGSSVETDAEGRFELKIDPRLAARCYLSFSVAKPKPPKRVPGEPERDYVTTYYPGVRELSQASLMDLTANLQQSGLHLRLRKAVVYHVRGKVAGSIPDLRITAFRETGD